MKPIILRKTGYAFFKSKWFYGLLAIFLLIIAYMLLLIYQLNPEKFFRKETTEFSLIIFIYPLAIYLHSHLFKKIKLEINDEGIKYNSGYPFVSNKFDWQLSWYEIQSVSLSEHIKLIKPELRYFLLRTHNKDIKVYPLNWIDENKPFSWRKQFSDNRKRLNYSKKITNTLIEDSVLNKIFEDKLLLSKDVKSFELNSEEKWTDINSSPKAIAMTSIFIASLFYFTTETYFTLSEFYAAEPPFNWFILVGILTVPIAYFWLKKSKLKPKEIGIMATLVGFGIAMVSYPMMLRLNQWTDKEGLQTYSYILNENGRWKSEGSTQKLPDLIFDLKGSDYWRQFKINAVMKFELRKGGLGFYQINMEPIYADQREFYEGNKKKVETAMQVNN